MNGLFKKIKMMLRTRRTRRKLQRTISLFAVVVVFVTTYALVLPAITMEKNAGCGIEEHQHDDSCYEDQLICGQEESADHQHTEDCYERVLVCGKEPHTHSASCYPDDTEADTIVPVAEDSADDGMNVPAEASGNGETKIPVSDPSDGTGVSTPSDPSGQTTDGQVSEGIVTEEPAAMATDAAMSVYPAAVFEDAITVRSAGLPTDVDVETGSKTETGGNTASGTDRETGAGGESKTPLDETVLSVHVEADADTFPEGTTMVLSEVTDDAIDTVASAVEGALNAQDEALNEQQDVQGAELHTHNDAQDASLTVQQGAKESELNAQQNAKDTTQNMQEIRQTHTRTRGFHALDISFYDLEGNKIEPLRPVRVSITSDAIREAVRDDTIVPVVVHVENETAPAVVGNDPDAENTVEENALAENSVEENAAAEITEAAATGRQDAAADGEQVPDTLTFEADSFSVYAIVYTVDFHWEANGRTYDFSIPGGGFASFYNLVKDLGIAADNTDTARDEIQELVDGVEKIEFSKPELVSVSKAEENTTVGAIKDGLGLACEYSADLTEDQIAEINAQEVFTGDWALISLKPFDTEESMNVTMKNGDAWSVKVTDAQISGHYISDSGKLFEVTVNYGEDAQIPDGAKLKITEFDTDSKGYETARKAVLADRLARNEATDPNVLGLAALDVSIIDQDNKEIEPAAPVQVDMKIKALPGVENMDEISDTLAIQHHVEAEDGVIVETVFDSQTADSPEKTSFRMETDETVKADETVVHPDSVNEEDFVAPSPEKTEDIDVGFETSSFSTITITWSDYYGKGTKIHYVDETGKELDVKNKTLPKTIDANSTSPAYLIYDIDGYEYSYTYLNNKERSILPQLEKDWDGWGYYTTSGKGYYLNKNSDIYVVYKKKAGITQGGTPTVKQSGSEKPPVAPRINKESTPNGDDTNTLALSLISDTAKLEVEKLADVIVVFDVSTSMKENNLGKVTRLNAAKKAVKDLADHLSKKKNSNGDPLVRMSLITFSTKASAVLGMKDLKDSGKNNGLSQIKTAVDNLSADGGTNWDHALQLANEENDLDSGRATFVIFVTDGDPTFRNARMDVTDAELAEEKNYHEKTDTYTDPNFWYLSDAVYGPGNNDRTGQCYAAAVEQGKAIVSAGKNIFTIGISNDVTKVDKFNSDIGGNGAYLATDSKGLEKAFADVEASISGASGWGNIQMTDGITKLTNTVQKTGLTNVGGDFTYWKAPAPDNWANMSDEQKNAYKPDAAAFKSWDPEKAGAALAKYNKETGAVEWNMGDKFMPEAGVTYQVRFKAWPSQEAYDYIAKLNNKTIEYDTLTDEVKAQIIKNGNTYTLKTNEPDAKTTYQTAIRTGNTVTTSGETKTLKFPSVEDLNLSVDKMKVTKQWKNSLDPDFRWKSQVTLLLTDDNGTLFKSIDLNDTNNYSAEDNFISCGLAKIEDNQLVIYESGHDFKLTEPEEYAYYWDLDSQVYRPMIINAKLNMLVKTDPPSRMGDHTYYVDGGTKYYKIGSGTYKAIATGNAAAEITATNIRRSNLNLTKKVVDEKGNPAVSSEAFTFTVTINDKQDKKIWFSVQTDANDPATVVKDLTTNAEAEVKDGNKTGYYITNSGVATTISIRPGWNLRFINLPNGTTYTITESDKEGYTFLNAAIDNNGTFSLQAGTATGSGTIKESNTQYTVTYTNQASTQQVYIHKTGQDGKTPLKGAVFSLYSKEDYEAEPKKAMKTDLTSDELGKIDLGRLVVGEYYLVETKAPAGYNLLTKPVKITVKGNEVSYQQIENSMSTSGQGVTGNKEQGYTLVVTNNEGYELPSTGGPGTRLFTILGTTLIAGAGLLLWMTRKCDRT